MTQVLDREPEAGCPLWEGVAASLETCPSPWGLVRLPLDLMKSVVTANIT